MISFEWLQEHKNDISVLVTVLGFSVVGIFASINKAFRFFQKRRQKRDDQAFYGNSYEMMLTLAIRDGSFSDGKHRSLKATIEDKKKLLKQKIQETVTRQLTLDENQIASGSTAVSYGEIISGDILMEPTVKDVDTNTESSLTALMQKLNSKNILLIGNAGEGKSLACLRIRNYLCSQASFSWPLFISTADFEVHKQSDILGSRLWCIHKVATAIGLQTLTDLEQKLIGEIIDESAVIVVDALDEIIHKIPKADRSAFISSHCIKSASLVSTRMSFYYSALKGVEHLNHFNVFSLEALSNNVKEFFVNNYCAKLYGIKGKLRSTQILRLITNSPALQHLSRIPILLVMLCELPSTIPEAQLNTITIYGHWVHEFTVKEIQKTYTELTYHELFVLLEDIAWAAFIRFEDRAEYKEIDLTDAVILDMIRERYKTYSHHEHNEILTLLVNSPLLTLQGLKKWRGKREVVFRHKSFYEFLIASRLNAWITGLRDDGADFFQYLETPEIAYFIKEFFIAIFSEKKVCEFANNRMLIILNSTVQAINYSSDEKESRLNVFAAGQIVYHLGIIANEKSIKKLTEMTLVEDFWIRRAAVIGMMFAGYTQPYHNFIDEMRLQISQNDFTLSRKNIAIELAYYGDQEFNKFDPTLDQGGLSCCRFLNSVAYELSLEVERPNWRLELFNILYLFNYRNCSYYSFIETIKEVYQSLIDGLEKIESDSSSAEFKEVVEMRHMLKTILKK